MLKKVHCCCFLIPYLMASQALLPSRRELGEDIEQILPEPTDLLQYLSPAVSTSPPRASNAACADLISILNVFQEQSSLLDSVLPQLVTTLCTAALAPSDLTRHNLFTVLRTISTVRGPKLITRLLPHDPATFRALLKFLFEQFPLGASSASHWETHYFLLLWLSAAIITPFPLATIVPGHDVDALYRHCLENLYVVSKISESAVALLTAFLNRKDARKYLDHFVGRCVSGEGSRGPRARLSAAALARIFKTGRRSELAPFVHPLFAVVNDLVDDEEPGEVKLKMKLVQRMALLFLKERPCTWRYDRGSRLVLFGHEKKGATSSSNATGGAAVMANNFVGKIQEVSEKSVEETGWIEAVEEDIVEQTVEILVEGLRHRETIVRWSAAKGIGRIAGRLPLEHAEDVVQAVIDLFTSPAMTRADSAWHGGCLALAELARRGLILPQTEHFNALFRVAKTAAAFDMRRGANSVGAHVRDAACYIVWALARAYTSADVAPHAAAIAEMMIPVALLDREVNCRRAASAALQECVGRLAQGVIVEGIALVLLCDYFSLNQRSSSYTKIAPQVASLENGIYFGCILDELWAGKLIHWDANVRSLASRALGALVSVDRDDVILRTVFPNLLGISSQRGDAVHRHGAVLGLAELTRAYGQRLPDSLRDGLRIVPMKIKDKGYFRGKVGDLMCSAACLFVEACAQAGIGIFSSTGAGRESAEAAMWILEFSLATLSWAEQSMEQKAVAISAYRHLCAGVVAYDPEWKTVVSVRICDGMVSASLVEQQRGFALAAGALGSDLASPDLFEELMISLIRHRDVEVRRNAAISLGRLATHPELTLASKIAASLGAGMKDQSTDERGDMGSWVREASMAAFADLIEGLGSFPDDCSLELVGELDSACLVGLESTVTQLCGKIDRTRGVAFSCLMRISRCLARNEKGGQVCRLDDTKRMASSLGAIFFDSAGDDVFCVPSGNYSLLDYRQLDNIAWQLLAVKAVEKAALAGIVANCGGVTGGGAQGSSQRWAADCVLEHALDLSRAGNAQSVVDLGGSIVKHIAGENARLVIPALNAFDYLIRYGVFSCPDYAPFLLDAVSSIRAGWKGHQLEVPRVAAGVRLLGEVGVVRTKIVYDSCPMLAVHRACLEALVVVLAGRVPLLRCVSAEAIYTILFEKQQLSLSVTDVSLAPAIALMLDTSWEILPTLEARSTRNDLCKILDIKAPAPPKLAVLSG